jgi:DNA topoisomerase I
MRSTLAVIGTFLIVCLGFEQQLTAAPKGCSPALLQLAQSGTEKQIAQKAGLNYRTDIEPTAIRREKKGKGFAFVTAQGNKVSDAGTLKRLESLKIPAPYTKVVISSDPLSHLQYTALDTSGKKQYRYHPDWNRARKEQKFSRVLAFGHSLPAIRNRIEKDLASTPLLSKKRVLAAMARTLDKTKIRVGNEEYAKENKTYGLTTLEKKRHASVSGNKITLSFVGKASTDLVYQFEDQEVARVLRQSQKLGGKPLFQFEEDGEIRSLSSQDVNTYLGEIAEGITAKDFRTWGATVETFRHLIKDGGRKEAIDAASEVLGNTPSIAEKHYIHPAVLEAFEKETLPEEVSAKKVTGLSSYEATLLKFLKKTSN